MYQNYPQPATSSYNGGLSYSPKPPYGGSQGHLSSPSHSMQASGSSSSLHASQGNSIMGRMDEKSACSLLQHLGKDELQLLLDNDSKLQDLINDLSQVRGIQEEHDNLVVSNKSIAEYNLSLQPKLEDLKRTVAPGYERQNALKTSLAEDKAKLDSFVDHQSLDTLLALLQTETAKVEEESERSNSQEKKAIRSPHRETVQTMAEEGSVTEPCTQVQVGNNLNSTLKYEQLRTLIDDDVYQGLKRHVFMRGKGRRPDLPKVKTVTNKLLLQLLILKEDLANNGITHSFRELKSLLEKLVPHTSHVTESRISHQMTATLRESLKKRCDEAVDFLEQEYDFHLLTAPLNSLGITRLHLQNIVEYSHPLSESISVDVVIALENQRQCLGEPPIFVRKWLRKLSVSCVDVSDSKLKSRIDATIKRNKDLSKRQKPGDVKAFLNEPFIPQTTCKELGVSTVKCTHCDILQKTLQETACSLVSQQTTNGALEKKVKELSQQLEVRNEIIKDLNKEKSALIERLTSCGMGIETLQENLKNVRNEKQKLLKKANKLEKTLLSQNSFNRKQEEDIKVLDNEMEEVKKENNKLKEKESNLIDTNLDLKKKVKTEQSIKSKYKKDKEVLKEDKERCMYALNNSIDVPDVTLKVKGNMYSDDVRQLYMSLMGEANVSSVQATKTVQLVAKHLFKIIIKKEELPSPRTCLNFMDEAHYIAKQHIASSIRGCNHFMYGTDGTSRQKKHYLEHHLVLDNGSTLSIGYSEVPDDKAETLLEKSIHLLDELSDIYCEVNDKAEKGQIFAEILTKMKCVMSDRAANMKLFNKKLLEYKKDALGSDAAIEFLYCNAHFLIALADETEKVVKVQEGLIEDKLGRDNSGSFFSFSSSKEAAAFRLMRTMSDVFGPRGDEKNGCREEWLADCDLHEVKSIFTSFRSNRFNNVFENSVAVLFHCNQSLNFLENSCSHSNLKLQSIILDLKDIRILSILTGIAIFATYLATPYWRLMNSNIPYAQFGYYVQAMNEALLKWSSVEFSVMTLFPEETHVFGEEFFKSQPQPQVAKCFFHSEYCNQNLAETVFKLICTHSLKAIKRQLFDFLPDGIYGGEIPHDVRELLSTCPLTNLTGERMFGDLDYDMVKRRKANSFLRSTVSMWKHNTPSKFLNKKKASEYRSIMAKARKYNKPLKKKHLEASQSVRRAAKRRIQENEEQKRKKELDEKERKAHLLTELLSQGGLCETEEDLKRVMNGPNALHNLKVQVRFRKYYMDAKQLRLTGNLRTLYVGICNHLGIEPDESLTLPMRKKRRMDNENEDEMEIVPSDL